MSTNTTNFNLVKPELTDVADITAMNGNWDTIDTELNKISGKQATVTGAATTILSDDLTENKALVSDADGKVGVSNVTSTELGYVSGVTSPIQTQFNDVGSGKANKPTITNKTLFSASWNTTNKTYSFESQYPSATYDVEIEPGQTATEEQLSAWTRAKLVGSATSNILTAVGEVPTVDIPIIVKVVVK